VVVVAMQIGLVVSNQAGKAEGTGAAYNIHIRMLLSEEMPYKS